MAARDVQMRLGNGRSPTLSADGKSVLAMSLNLPHAILELPTGAGESKTISTGNVKLHAAYFFPDGSRILMLGNQPGHGLRLWVLNVSGGTPSPSRPRG